MNKTVYVLGAGFSMSAGAPSQERLVEKIFQVERTNPGIFGPGQVEKFKNFLSNSLDIPKSLHSQVPLEDIFTPLDRCILDNISFRDLNIDKIKETRELVYFLIGKTLEALLRSSSKDYIDTFARHLISESSQRSNYNYKKSDPVSVISTNWDILLDNSLKQIIDAEHRNKAVVDYCCYISSYETYDQSIKPGLEMLGLGGFNIKFLKLHGSLNWLQCPRCLRLYVDFGNKIALYQYVNPKNCRHCDKNFGSHHSHKLTSNLIMPTFLKNLSNPQYKLIWQNAGVELSEANKIVFIGYSLPSADFEMRQLLSRMVRTTAEIEVVDFGKETDSWIIDTKKRYSVFFGGRKVSFFLDGAKDYLIRRFGA